MQNPLSHSRRIVIKIGSSLIVENNAVRQTWLKTLADDIKQLSAEVIVVTSGAVALGRKNIQQTTNSIPAKQAASSIGQIHLMNAYTEAFEAQPIAQVLLTLEDTEQRKRHLNVQATFRELLRNNVIPVINENDTVATAELRYGDNDRLAARVAQLSSADVLILLTDIDGLYTENPQISSTAEHIPIVESLMATKGMALDTNSDVGTGGMKTKLQAAQLANAVGFDMIIADGRQLHPIKALCEGATHTFFPAQQPKGSARQQWLAAMVQPLGTLQVDDGAANALKKGNSLLPVGVIRVTGVFDRGDPVQIIDKHGHILAQGLSRYRSRDALKIMGQQADKIDDILGYYYGDTLVHKDDMANL